MNANELQAKKAIEEIISGYKSVHLIYCYVEGDSVTLTDSKQRRDKYPFIAKRILNMLPEIGHVIFTGGNRIHVYTRNTLKL